MEKLVQFGAGNIGRSFIGQLFARGGYEVVFVDVDERLISALNERRSYCVEVADDPPGELLVQNVRAVNGNDREAVVRELVSARVAGTAVGANALKYLYPNLAHGLIVRQKQGMGPLDIILCENLHGAAALVAKGLAEQLPPGFPLEDAVGLVETSIGKMVPLMPEALRARDPLLVRAEAYNTLIVDARGFRNPIPEVPGLAPKDNMPAYVDRKLYVHNLGHAAVAYEAARLNPSIQTIAEAIAMTEVRSLAEAAMRESAQALELAYPGALEEHIQDLLRRFRNPHLGDTIFRVGRDVRRKLSKKDRIIGAMLLDLQHGVEPVATAKVVAAALEFRSTDENGVLDPADRQLFEEELPHGPEHILKNICGLDASNLLDRKVMEMVLRAMERNI